MRNTECTYEQNTPGFTQFDSEPVQINTDIMMVTTLPWTEEKAKIVGCKLTYETYQLEETYCNHVKAQDQLRQITIHSEPPFEGPSQFEIDRCIDDATRWLSENRQSCQSRFGASSAKDACMYVAEGAYEKMVKECR